MNRDRGRFSVIAFSLVLAAFSTQKVEAQAPPVLPSTRVLQAGPASLYPVISLRNVGTDSNVYNDGVAPKEDFTYSITPKLFAVVPIGGTRFVGQAAGDFIYFQTYKDQQSANGHFDGRYEVVDAKIRPFATASFASHRERQGREIDARARQNQTALTLGTDFELTAKTSLTGWGRRERISWDERALYMGVPLAEQLNSTTDFLAAGARFRLTPLTSIITVAEIQRDRFETAPERDADSVRLAPTVEFENGAALSGQARVGYRIFRPLSPALEEYRGLVASAGLGYSIIDYTRVYADLGRDVKYSYDPLQPYYLESGLSFKVIQRIVGPFEAVAIGERWRLQHQRVGGTSFDGRQEDTTTVGGGVGFRISREMELTFTAERTRRTSTEPVRRGYERRRVLASISYGV
jgi:hypothetical protein